MKYGIAVLLALALLFSSCGCRQAEEVVNALLEGQDNSPPVLLKWEMSSPTTATLSFNEPVVITSGDFSIAGIAIVDSTVSMAVVKLTLAEPLPVGSSARLEGRVEDLWRNSLRFTITLWAKNPNPAALLINEFTTKGTEANPDRVELVVTSRGNLAGLTLYAGTPDRHTDRLIFEDRWVERGTYIVVRFQAGNDGLEYTTELLNGLSSNNGALSLALTPEWGSPIIDAVVWGNLITTTFDGFGSQALQSQVTTLYEAGQWASTVSGDSIDSTNSTATRSFCRNRLLDTNSNRDWYICDTRQASFGALNSEIRFAE